MNNKEKIIKFLQLKNAIIERETGINYIVPADIEDIESWSDMQCNLTYEYMYYEITRQQVYGLGYATCVWCIFYKEDGCKDCGYGKRHKLCSDDDSLYNSYKTTKLTEILSNKVYLNILENIKKDG